MEQTLTAVEDLTEVASRAVAAERDARSVRWHNPAAVRTTPSPR
ncbi:hypothetical protein [Rhodococcus sp. YH3-3]|nr:hypothetical protein [Rhodococcus sp. YH3-3]